MSRNLGEESSPVLRVLFWLSSAAFVVMLALVGAKAWHYLNSSSHSTRTTVVTKSISRQPATQPVVSQQEAPRVEVAFVVDTTGSMSSLIEGAKRKIWSIASRIADGQPTPDLDVALIAYRDITDEYVTKRYDFRSDLDRFYMDLRGLSANGGGDTPEHVSRALTEAVEDLSWSSDQSVLKLVFLVGDAPPHTDYQDGYDFEKAAMKAAARGININTIRCGGNPDTATFWSRIASLGHGDFTTIDQSGGMMAVSTPYDEKLADLNARLAEKTVTYGSSMERNEAREGLREAGRLDGEAAASRASYYGKVKKLADKDLVADVIAGDVSVADMPVSEMPEELQKMDDKERERYIESLHSEQRAIKSQIRELSKKRDAHLEQKRAEMESDDAFDEQVVNMLRQQAASKGIDY